jgi:MoaA/NifB/PqqE/SkfB family radical SAM enzyme
VDGLRALSSKKTATGARTPYVVLLNPTNRLNYQDVDRMVDLAEETGCNAISFTPFKTTRGEMRHYALSEQEQAGLRNHLIGLKSEIEKRSLEHDIERFVARSRFHEIERRLPCYTCWFHSRIKVDGAVVACGRSELPLGNLKTQSFTEIWNGEAYRRERRKRLSADGYRYRNEIADCEVCGFVQNNRKIHRVFKYLSPLLPHRNESNGESPRHKNA